MLPTRYVEANCVKCHDEIADLATYNRQPVAPKLNEGRLLFTTWGCANCHLVDDLADTPRAGPDLTHVGDKLSRAYLQRYIHDPGKHRPATRMRARSGR